MAFAWLEKWARSKKSKKSLVAAEESDVLAPLAEHADKGPRRERKHRISVSAEKFGRINRIEDVVIPNHPKTDEEYERLSCVLSRTDLFAVLQDEEIERLIPAFVEVKFSEGTMFIKEQERGDCLYVVESGSVKVTKMIDGQEEHLCIMGPTESVGELALLHCCPRAATCTALADLTVWKLDREPFSVIVRQAAIERRSSYLDFLNGVSVISDLDSYSRSRVCDALKTKIFGANELVITKGAIGDDFFILVEGSCVAVHGGQVVKDYSPGEYFGELALLHDERRKCDIRVTSKQVKVLAISKDCFTRLLHESRDKFLLYARAYPLLPETGSRRSPVSGKTDGLSLDGTGHSTSDLSSLTIQSNSCQSDDGDSPLFANNNQQRTRFVSRRASQQQQLMKK